MKKTQIACKSGYKYKALENWAGAQIDYYFFRRNIFIFLPFNQKGVSVLSDRKKIPSLSLSFFSAVYIFFLSSFHLWLWHAHPT